MIRGMIMGLMVVMMAVGISKEMELLVKWSVKIVAVG